MILDMYPYANKMGVRRALFTSPLVAMLNIQIFPFLTMFKRSNQQAILMEPYVFLNFLLTYYDNYKSIIILHFFKPKIFF